MDYNKRLLQVNEENVVELLEKSECKYLDQQEVFSRISETNSGRKYIKDNFDSILDKVSKLDNFIFFCYRTFINDRSFIMSIAHHNRLDVRGSFMVNVTECEKSRLREYYPNITDYLVNRDDAGNVIEIMNEGIVSTIAANILDCEYDRELFQELKEFILKNYQYNHLLAYIHAIDTDNDTNDLFHVYEEITSDIERLYQTSSNYQLEFFDRCGYLVPEYLRTNIEHMLKLFGNCIDVIEDIYAKELGNSFIALINRYSCMSLNPLVKIGDEGTTCNTFVAGDFLIKYIWSSHSVYGPDYPCPRCFLINKPHKEIISRNSRGCFLGKLEVQTRLFEPLRESQTDILDLFIKELKSLGFFCDDLLACEGKYNIYRLKDYHDADTDDPECLPEWFKENPYVLVDRDCVYPIEKREEVNRIYKESDKYIKNLKI